MDKIRTLNTAVDQSALVQVSGPDRIDLTIEHSEPHLVTVTKRGVRMVIARRLVVHDRRESHGLTRNAIETGCTKDWRSYSC